MGNIGNNVQNKKIPTITADLQKICPWTANSIHTSSVCYIVTAEQVSVWRRRPQ